MAACTLGLAESADESATGAWLRWGAFALHFGSAAVVAWDPGCFWLLSLSFCFIFLSFFTKIYTHVCIFVSLGFARSNQSALCETAAGRWEIV